MRLAGIVLAFCVSVGALGCSTPNPYQQGVEYDEAGQHAKAVSEFTKAIAMDPGHPAPRHGRGLAYMNLGDYESAIEDFDEAIRLDPNYYLAYYTRGTLYSSKLGDHARGIQDLDKCIALNGQFPVAYQNRAVSYNAIGQREHACLDWRRACELGLGQACAAVEELC